MINNETYSAPFKHRGNSNEFSSGKEINYFNCDLSAIEQTHTVNIKPPVDTNKDGGCVGLPKNWVFHPGPCLKA